MVYSSYAALAGGNHVGILIKSAPREKMIPYILPVHTEDIYWLRSDSETTSIRNQFLDDKHERRSTTALAQGSTITVAELPEGISAKIYQLAGLMKGDYEDDIIKVLRNGARLRWICRAISGFQIPPLKRWCTTTGTGNRSIFPTSPI